MQPTILTDIAPGNPAFRDEFFGPVVSFFRVKTETEAIALANDSDFGLAGSVWTRDEARGLRVASRVDTGMMFINNIDWTDAELPFGGIKHSGYGRELGQMGIQEFVNKKLVRSGAIAAPAWFITDAFGGAMAKIDELRQDFTASEAVARGADFPKAMA
jgi:succinate-semialdehyde dehydrogenase/glutarate-semialdehyde dehydrogenase